MSAIAKKNPSKTQPVKPNVIYVPREKWKENKKPMFKWAENCCARLGIKTNYLNILKVIISFTDAKGITYATIETIHKKLIQFYGLGAPSRRTIERAIHKFCTSNLIKRDEQKTYKGLVKTRLVRFKSAMRSTPKWRAEYISSQKDIYMRKAKTKLSPPSSSIDVKIQERTSFTPCRPKALGGEEGASLPKMSKEEQLKALESLKCSPSLLAKIKAAWEKSC